MDDLVTANKRKSWLLLGSFMAVIAVLLAAVALLLGGGLVGLAIAVLLAGVAGLVAYRSSPSVALRLSRAQPAAEEDHKRYHNVVEGLCVASGLPKPSLYVIDSPAPNAFSVGTSPRDAAVVVTTGMLEALNRVELEGVLAHELSHIKSDDILVATLAVTTVGIPLRPVPPLAAAAMRRIANSRRETLADMSAVELTRYPPGLLSALEKLESRSTEVTLSSHAIAHLWINQPPTPTHKTEAGASADGPDAYPPLEERIALLREL